jgi:hypothetical protein
MVLRNFSPPSVIMCHHSIGAVAYVGRSVLLEVKSVKCTRKDPAHTARFRRVSRVRRNHPWGVRHRNTVLIVSFHAVESSNVSCCLQIMWFGIYLNGFYNEHGGITQTSLKLHSIQNFPSLSLLTSFCCLQ